MRPQISARFRCVSGFRLALIVFAAALLPAAGSAVAGTIATYLLNDNGGTTAHDSSVNGNNATLVNFANTAAGGNGVSTSGWTSAGQLKFNGSSNQLSTPVALSSGTPGAIASNTLGSAANGSFTLEAHLTYDGTATATWEPFFGESRSGSYDPTQVFFIGKTSGQGNEININLGGLNGSGGSNSFNLTTDLLNGSSHEFALVYNGATHMLTTYVDYVSIDSRAVVSPFTVTGTSNLMIGADGRNEFWNGLISDVRVSNAALTSSQFIVPEPGTFTRYRRGRLGADVRGASSPGRIVLPTPTHGKQAVTAV